ncbi:hypothetical protein IFR05_016633 [Cadophora sp. M221]|nr:hypothetical protein IFR05_016633 [Cadophora sp. M221]
MSNASTPLHANGASAISINDLLKALCRVPTLTETKFEAFRCFYDEVSIGVRPLCDSGDTIIQMDGLHPTTHEAIFRAVEKLRSGPEKTAEAFWTEAFPSCDRQKDQIDAARRTVKLTYLIDPASQDNYSSGFRFENESVFPVKWMPM